MQTVFSGEDLPVFLEHGIAGDGFIFLGAEDEADGGVVAFDFEEVSVEADIAVHLADVLVGELADFEVDEDEAFQEVIVEDEVHEEFIILEDDALLAGDEGESASHFEKEGLEVVHDGLLEFGFVEAGAIGEAEEFENGGGFENAGWVVGGGLALLADHAFLVAAGEEAFVVEAMNLALEFTNIPTSGDGFLLVKFAGFGLLHTHDGEAALVEKSGIKGRGEFITHCVVNWSYRWELATHCVAFLVGVFQFSTQ